MRFYVKWFLYGLRRRPALLAAAFIPLLAFLLVTGLSYDRFSVSLVLPLAGSTPVAVRSSPIAVVSVADFAAEGSRFFAEELTPGAWRRLSVRCPAAARYDIKARRQWVALINSLRLTYDDAGGRVTIAYEGPDLELGRTLTAFGAERLLARVRAGRQRRKRYPGAGGEHHADSTPQEIAIGKAKIKRYRAWWRAERLPAAAASLVLPLIFVLVLSAYLEFTHPAFKSGRQAARYLDLPILGTLPNLDVLSTLLGADIPKDSPGGREPGGLG